MQEIKRSNIDKIATIILVIILTLTPIVVLPTEEYNFPKMIVLLSSGLGLLVLIPFKLKSIKIDKTDICIIAFSLFAILSTAFSSNVVTSIFGAKYRFEGILVILIYVLIYFNSKYSFIKFKYFENILVWVYTAICVLACIQYYLPDSLKIPILSGNPSGTFGHTNFIGSFISMILPAFMFKYIVTGKYKYIFPNTISFSVMIMCSARSSWVAFAVYTLIIIIYLIVKKDKKFLVRFIILAVLFTICFTIVSLKDNYIVNNKIKKVFNEIQSMADDGLKNEMGSGRIKIWKMTLDVIIKKPILGCGVDNLYEGLTQCSPKELMEYMVAYKAYVDKAHNEYLHIAATMGIPALVSYISFLGTLIIPHFKKIIKDEKSMLFVIVILSYLVQAFFNISTIGIAPIFWFVLGQASRKNHEQ